MSIGVWGQTLVQYPLNSDFTPNIGPATGLNPILKYYDPPIEIPLANVGFSNNWMNFNNNGDRLVLTFDATMYEGLSVEFSARLWAIAASANIKLYMQIGSSPEVLLEERSFLSVLFPANASFSQPLNGADQQSNVSIIIEGSVGSLWDIDSFGINNLRIIANNTTMTIRRDLTGYPNIPHQANASITYDTDFGSLLTNEEEVIKRFRISNTGTRELNISNMHISPNDQDFEFVGAIPTSVPVGQNRTFEVRFRPQSQGFKLAEVIINSNSIPDNPFRFQILGYGKSCNTEPVPINVQHFENSTQNLPVSTYSGTYALINGTANSHTPTTIPQLYPSGNLYSTGATSGTHGTSWYVRGDETGEVTLEFGPVDITDQQEVSINFDVAAFGATNNTNSGVRGTDYVTLSVQRPDGSWTEEVRLRGSGRNDTRYKYNFGGTFYARTYDGDGVVASLTNNENTKYGRISLRIPNSFGSNQLKFRIKANTDPTAIPGTWPWSPTTYHNHNFWLIDNVHVAAGNAIAKVWNGSAWSGGTRPNPREKAIINGTYNFTVSENQDLEVCECEVRSGRKLTIPTGRTLIVKNKILNLGSADNVIVENDANLIQIEDGAANQGSITVQKLFTFTETGTANDRKQYNFVISPVVDQNLKTIYPGTNNSVMEYRESNNMFYNHSGIYTAGKGFAIKEPSKNDVAGPTVTAAFNGIPFNGELDYPLNYSGPEKGYNLIGNPYPSNLDIKSLYDNNSSIIESTFYFWDNRGNTIYTQQGSNYGGSNYAIYNALNETGVGVGAPTIPAPGAPAQERIPNRYVKVGSGFIVQAKSAGSIRFNNTYRTSDNSGPAFFGKYMNQNSLSAEHATDINTENENQKDRYWLTLTTMSGMEFMNAVVYFDEGTNEYAADDSDAMGASDEIFTLVGQQYLAINGRAPFENTDVVPLGVRHFADGKYIIDIHTKEGVFANGQKIYLKDKYLNGLHDLTKGAYGYESEAGEFIDRFEILYKKPGLTNTALTSAVVNHLKIFKHNQDIVLESSDDKILGIEIFNLSGTSLYKRDNINSKEHRVFRESLGKQILIINLITEKGELVSRKFINN